MVNVRSPNDSMAVAEEHQRVTAESTGLRVSSRIANGRWDKRSLVSLCSRVTVGFVGSMATLFRSEGVPLLRGQNVTQNGLDFGELRFIAPATHSLWQKSSLCPDDVVVVRVGYPGTAAVIPAGLGDLNAASLVILRPRGDLLDSRYLAQVLNSAWGKKQIAALLVGGAQQVFNTRTAMELQIPAPALVEQQAIAAALSDVDGLIASLDRLIAKKRAIKQAAMQQLLTGKTRLPGFKSEWQRVKLGELGTFSRGSGIRKDQIVADGVPCVRYGELYTVHRDVVRSVTSFIDRSTAATSTRLRQGDLLFAGSGETSEEIGKCAAWVGEEEGYAGGDIVIFSPVGQNSVFLGYLMNHPSVAEQKARLGQGDAVVHINPKHLSTLSFRRPELDEQAAIAQVLDDIDAEIAAIEARRMKASMLKQGMMQALLTGRVRLV